MTAGDSEEVERIQGSSLPYSGVGWAAADFLRLESWVLVAEGAVAAFVVARQVAEDEFELLNIAVALDQRRRGYGRALLKAVLQRFPGIWFLEVRASNSGAEALYSELGFQRSGRRRDYYRSPVEDAFEMTRRS